MGGCTCEGEELDEDGRRWKKGKGPSLEKSLAFLELKTRKRGALAKSSGSISTTGSTIWQFCMGFCRERGGVE